MTLSRRHPWHVPLLAALLALLGCAIALAQGRPERAPPRGDPPPPGRHVEPNGERPERKPHDDGGRRRGEPRELPPGAGLPLRPSPADFGPLAEGEEDALLSFVQHEFSPQMHDAMQRVRVRDPQGFRARFEKQMAPRLRYLKRVFELDPDLGDAIARHTQGLAELRRMRGGPHPPGPRPPVHAQRLRERVAASVEGEMTILDRLANLRERIREQEVERTLASLLNESNAADQPPPVRELIAAFRESATDEERAQRRQELAERIRERLVAEVAELRERAASLRANWAEEVDRRVRGLEEGGPPRRDRP